MGHFERQADAQQEAQEQAALDAAKRSEYEEVLGKITVLAHQGLMSGTSDGVVQALIWIKKACGDAGFRLT